MEKLIIWVEKMNALSTPIRGMIPSFISIRTFREQWAITAAEATHRLPPTAGESKASAICMGELLNGELKYKISNTMEI
jgi:hypothetical protein